VTKWKPLFGRVTFITNSSPGARTASALELFQQVWNNVPQSFQNPPNALLASNAQGLVGELAANCAVLPNRIDLTLAPPSSLSSSAVSAVPLFKDAAILHAELVRISSALGRGEVNIPAEFDRVAVFVQFATVLLDALEANKAIMEVLPEPYRVRLNDEEAFAFQVNYRRNIPGLGSSRAGLLTRWSVEQFQIVTLAVPGGGLLQNAPSGLVQPEVRSFLAACVSFDYNTLQTTETLTRHQQSVALLDGLSAIADAQSNYGLKVEGFRRVNTAH
jgi:hypothetical protein